MRLFIVRSGPFNIPLSFTRLNLWSDPLVTRLHGNSLTRVTRLGLSRTSRVCAYSVRWRFSNTRLTLTVVSGSSLSAVQRTLIRREVASLFALDTDLSAFYAFARSDHILRALTRVLRGLRPPLAPDPFELLVSAICGQQVNARFARVLRERLVRAYGTPHMVHGVRVWCFPSAARLLDIQIAELRRLRMSARKAESVIAVARAHLLGHFNHHRLAPLSDLMVLHELTSIKGIGPWSAEWFMANYLGRGTACPVSDLVVRRAVGKFYHKGRMPSEEEVRSRAAAWGPFRSLAAVYLIVGMRQGLDQML